MQKFLAIMICIYLPGVCISYQILFTELTQYIVEMFGANKEFTTSLMFRFIVGVPASLLMFFPLSLMKDMSAFQYGGLASVIALMYVAIVMIVETPFYFKQNIDNPLTEVFAFKIDLNFFSACAMTFFSYTCQVQLMPVYSELVNPNFRRINKIIQRSMMTNMVFYMVIAVCGYMSTFNATN